MRRAGHEPCVVWLGGFRSDMTATKAQALDDWAARTGAAFLRMDYSGHGRSGGRFEDGTVSRWLEEALAVIRAEAGPRPILVGSSMGGWIALLAARALRAEGRGLSGLVLIAPAADFTQALMWPAFPEAVRAEIMEKGVWLRPSAYSDEPYPITRALIEDGRRHLLLDGAPLTTGCPVHILQGMQDPDVPWRHALRVVEMLPGDEVVTTLIKDGDHRLSRPQDIERLVEAVAGVARPA
ncbi:alpha/beta hydrolase [Alsobacter sp. SYSU M60028]|uniref:Palmitoyl-protein thioesterase ABHD10, mitochondrial n=1 Tax=Alsobacter ponti TaxID=2962936 RepID=A0ABT1LI09_9HYPH|nr:alpha/beta hydrolase [Alsobacter ponti]MCP8940596.1 alpha/beta hydrolase [Alsobacter ponti]